MCAHQSEYFLFIVYVFPLTKHFFWAPHSPTDMLVIIRLKIKETFEDILLLNISFQGELWGTFPPLEIKKSEEQLTTSYLSVSLSSLPSLPFNSLVFQHVSLHLLILKRCSVITWDRGGLAVRLALCSFPSFLSYLLHMQITIMLLQVICSLLLC